MLNKYMNRPTPATVRVTPHPNADPIVRAFRDKPQASFARHLLVCLAILLGTSGLTMLVGQVVCMFTHNH